MKKFLTINLIVQIILITLSSFYSAVIATGWDDLRIWVVLIIFAVPTILVDIVGLIVCFIKKKKIQNMKYVGSEWTNDADTEQKIEIAQGINKDASNDKNIALKIIKIVAIVLVVGATLFETFIVTAYYYKDLVLHDKHYYNSEDVYVRDKEEVIKCAKKNWKNSIFLSSRIEEEPLSEESSLKTIYTFKDSKYGFEFTIEQYVKHLNGFMYDSGYKEILKDNYDEMYEDFVVSKLTEVLGDKYNNNYMTVNNVYISDEINVIVGIDPSTKEDITERVVEQLDDIAKDASIELKKIDKEKMFGEKSILGTNTYKNIKIELNESRTSSTGVREYWPIGKYFAIEGIYKKVKRDLDGIILPDDEW